jgi:cell division protein FtsQ
MQIADACGRALRRTVPALVGLFVLAAIGGTAWASYRFVTTSPRFAITHVEVKGNHQLSDDQIVAQLSVRAGDNVFATNLDEVVQEVRENPWIASAEAHRELPHTIVIEVREHVPAAVVELGGLYLVDGEGHPFKRAEIDDGAGLPIITGLDRTAYVASPAATAAQIKNAMTTLERWRSVEDRPSIGEVHVDAHGALTLVTYEQAISIQLGDADAQLEQRMHTFDATWAELTSAERARTRAIHLTSRGAAPRGATDDTGARSDQVTVAFAAPATP